MKFVVRTVRWSKENRVETDTVFTGYDPKTILKKCRHFIADEVVKSILGLPNFVAEWPKEVR